MPRPLVYYYFKNKDDILQEIYQETTNRLRVLADDLVKDEDDEILRLVLRYILHYRMVVQNPVLQECYLERRPSVFFGKDAVQNATEGCLYGSSELFRRFRPDADVNELYAFIISCDALVHALFEGLAKGILELSLRDVILYLMESTIMPRLNISHETVSRAVAQAFELVNTLLESTFETF